MAKKVVFWLVVAFAVYYLVTAPTAAASAVRGAAAALRTAAQSLLTFFGALTP